MDRLEQVVLRELVEGSLEERILRALVAPGASNVPTSVHDLSHRFFGNVGTASVHMLKTVDQLREQGLVIQSGSVGNLEITDEGRELLSISSG